MTCGFLSRGKLAETEAVIPAVPVVRIARSPTVAILRLKQLREAAGLSLADVAERSGIDRAAICRLENGQHQNPTIGTLNRYADALGQRVSFQGVDVASRRSTKFRSL